MRISHPLRLTFIEDYRGGKKETEGDFRYNPSLREFQKKYKKIQNYFYFFLTGAQISVFSSSGLT
jgi:hypothetical protein